MSKTKAKTFWCFQCKRDVRTVIDKSVSQQLKQTFAKNWRRSAMQSIAEVHGRSPDGMTAACLEQRFPVSVGDLVQAGIDGHRDFVGCRRLRGPLFNKIGAFTEAYLSGN